MQLKNATARDLNCHTILSYKGDHNNNIEQ